MNTINYSRLAASADGKRIYVFAPFNAVQVLVINAADFSKLFPITLAAAPRGMAVSPDSSRLYVGSTDNTLTIFSTSTGAILYHYAVTPKPGDILFSPDGRRAYVLIQNLTSDSIMTIDTSTSMPLGTYTVSNFPGFGSVFRISTDGTYLYGGGSPSGYAGLSEPAWSLHLVSGLPSGQAVELPSAQGMTDIGVRPPALLTALKKKGGQLTSQ